METLMLLDPYKVWILIYIAVYGIAFGIKNTILRLRSFCFPGHFLQSSLGHFLDALWIVSIIIVVIISL